MTDQSLLRKKVAELRVLVRKEPSLNDKMSAEEECSVGTKCAFSVEDARSSEAKPKSN